MLLETDDAPRNCFTICVYFLSASLNAAIGGLVKAMMQQRGRGVSTDARMDIRPVMGGGLSRMKYKQDEKDNNNGPPPTSNL